MPRAVQVAVRLHVAAGVCDCLHLRQQLAELVWQAAPHAHKGVDARGVKGGEDGKEGEKVAKVEAVLGSVNKFAGKRRGAGGVSGVEDGRPAAGGPRRHYLRKEGHLLFARVGEAELGLHPGLLLFEAIDDDVEVCGATLGHMGPQGLELERVIEVLQRVDLEKELAVQERQLLGEAVGRNLRESGLG